MTYALCITCALIPIRLNGECLRLYNHVMFAWLNSVVSSNQRLLLKDVVFQ